MRLTFNQNRKRFETETRHAKLLVDDVNKVYYADTMRIALPFYDCMDEEAKRILDRRRVITYSEKTRGDAHQQTARPADSANEAVPSIYALLRPYQNQAVQFILERNHSYLFIPPGLGKTPIAARAAIEAGAYLIYICPPSVRINTERELLKWGLAPNQFCVLPDSQVHRYVEAARKQAAHVWLVVDEAHRFKYADTRRGMAVYTLADSFERVVLMSGTAITRGYWDLWAPLRYLAWNCIDYMDQYKYAAMYCDPLHGREGFQIGGSTNGKELRKRLAPFMFSVLKKDAAKDLPARMESILIVGENLPRDLASMDKELLKQYSPIDIAEGKYNLETDGHIATYRRLLGEIKVKPTLDYLIDELDFGHESFIVFCYHRDVANLLYEGLKSFAPSLIVGGMTTEHKQINADRFQNRETRVIIGNSAMWVGYTLTAASQVLLVEPSWTPADNEQAIDRAHRIGQTLPVLARYVCFENSIDRKVINVNLRKREKIEDFKNGGDQK